MSIRHAAALRRTLALGLSLALLLPPQHADAQARDPDTVGPAPHGLRIQLALEPHLVVSVGYLWGLGPHAAEPELGIGVGVRFSPYLLGQGAARVNVAAAGRWRAPSGWGAAVHSEAYLVRGHNRAGTVHGLGIELRGAPGRYGDRWSVAADLGWQATLLAHIRHSAAARDAFDERHPGDDGADGPVDGWYGSTAHRLRIGVVGARRVSDSLALQLAAGSRFSLQRQGILLGFAHGQVPVYLEASANVAW